MVHAAKDNEKKTYSVMFFRPLLLPSYNQALLCLTLLVLGEFLGLPGGPWEGEQAGPAAVGLRIPAQVLQLIPTHSHPDRNRISDQTFTSEAKTI